VGSYAAPGYPAAGDHVDFDFKDAAGWGLSGAVAAVMVAAAGSSGCTAGLAEDPLLAPSYQKGSEASTLLDNSAPPSVVSVEATKLLTRRPNPSGQEPKVEPAFERDVDNPFTFQKSNLPPDNIWGKGVPGVLPEEVAVSAILKAFSQRGLELEPGVAYSKNGVAVELDGLLPGSDIGFEYLSTEWSYMPWSANREPGDPAEQASDYQSADEWVEDPDTGEWIPVVTQDDPQTASEPEMKLLDADMAGGQRHIAMLNSLDPRFVYRPEMEFGSDDYWSSLGVENATPDEAEDRLVAAVHQFIDFLEQEGAL